MAPIAEKRIIASTVYLKRIVLHGFKSFADRTEFDFGPGVTAVVGPNGCGKSNLLDAVRWVLGEQSARSLRGKRMADVIFAGSRSRKPAAAAQVELVFDNSAGFLATDEPEVSIARVLYRSGDSDYRMNGNSCRLKDIRQLFLDTGVGVDAYSIIEQGRVDMLLQADPVQRREIFEEAAGISRYRVQRAEAQRKLERSQNNLLRLNDIIEELERQLRSVKLAAGKARRWQEYDHRLRELRASFSLAEYDELETGRAGVQAEMAEQSDRLQSERAELAAHDAAAAEHKRQLQQLDEQIQQTDAELAGLRSELSTLGERIAQSERRAADLMDARQRRQLQSAEISQQIAELEQRVAAESAALQVLAQAAEVSAGRIAQLQDAHGQVGQRRDGARQALDQARAAVFDAARTAALLHNEQNNLAGQRERLVAQSERLNARRTALNQEKEELGQRRAIAAENVGRLDQRVSELGQQIRGTEAQLAELREARQVQETEIGAAKERRSAILSRLELLDDMERRLEGVDGGTQTVLAWRNETDARAGTVLGLVADLLHIDDPRVRALQPVLSTFENHVAVEDSYAFLTELGRRPELPGPVRVVALDRLPEDISRGHYDDAPGFVARASAWVDCAPQHRKLAEHLLGRVIVVDSIERAMALAHGAPPGYVFVTLDGRSVSTDGRITIAGAQAATGLISRKAEIRHLQQERDEVETSLERCIRQRNEVEERISDTQLRLSASLNEIAAAQREHAEVRSALMRLEGELARLQREAEVSQSELEAIERAVAEMDDEARKLAAESEAAGQNQQERESRIEVLERELAELEAAVGRASAELTEARIEAGRNSEKQAASSEAFAQLQASRASLERDLERAGLEAEQAAAQIEQSRAEVEQARARQTECAAQIELLQAQTAEQRQCRQELRARIEEFGALARSVGERIHEIESQLHAGEVTLREYEVRRDNLVSRVRDELNIDLAAAYEARQEQLRAAVAAGEGSSAVEQDWEAVRAEINQLREKLARLGNVNLDAISELEELTPRYENLVAQRTDLLASIERLQALIIELDNESQTRFAATFNQIREYFQELFRQLFGGGKADIVLMEPEKPLECGIEIIARPPGKEPQSLSLLSGGEKTMAAVALVMAVFKSKPSPFAFLDEVDAALDEANTERFNNMLQGFLAHSQFVVITHSKRTMQGADVLYGVTMEEPGVSKRVSVRFDNGRVQTPNVA
jgi:chromosome segregation protein